MAEMRDTVKVAKHYRLRAEEVRTIADGMARTEPRKMLMQIADEYEQWALAAEAEAREKSRQVLRNPNWTL